jgi:hypothetical protein
MTSTSPGIAVGEWQPFHEPARATLARTIGIALVAGALFARQWGGMARWPVATIVMLWPALGGHFLELWFLNWLRPRLSRNRAVQAAARVALWFVGGVAFLNAMRITAAALTGLHRASHVVWWLGGVAFVCIELVAQLVLRLRGRPSFYDGRG